MTIYIAGPMTGLPEYNLPAFYKKEKELKRESWLVLNPAKIGEMPDYDMYLPINKAMLDGADAIYLLNGWENSKGAVLECKYALEKGLEVYLESNESTISI